MTAPSAATSPVEGFFDEIGGGAVWGWAWFPDRPNQPALVEALIDGVVVARGYADRRRVDLQEAGKRGGLCAFEIALPATRRHPGAEVQIRVGGQILQPGARVLPAEGSGRSLKADTGDLIEAFVDSIDTEAVRGWAYRVSDPARPVLLTLLDSGQPVATFAADGWRGDLAEIRQGDGRGAFDFRIPDSLRDGGEHEFDLRTEAGVSLLSSPAKMAMPAKRPEPRSQSKARSTHWAPWRAPKVSFIVNFYNMRREAERTLTSLSRRYQQGVGRRPYEVICVDNGSNPPLEESFVKSFGPEFRLFRPKQPSPSPSRAINAAAREAKGRHLAIMIDGAHILTPGVLAGALDAISEDSQAVVALRHWFIGGDQRWLGLAGYDRPQEDMLFSRIKWPEEPYDLFRIGAPIGESPNNWFDGMNESNCLFLPAALYRALGGLSEAFEEPGGGLVNLDLFRRAVDASPGKVTCLIGEASFHQYHGGATTNVSDEEKDRRVRLYNTNYRTIRGAALEPVDQDRIKLRGVIRTPLAVSSRQRSLMPVAVGLTDQVRPKSLGDSFDGGARDHLLAAFVESRGDEGLSRWNGKPVRLAAGDLVNIQEIIGRVRPLRIVHHGEDEGLVGYLESILTMLGLEHTRVIWVSHEDRAPAPRIDQIAAKIQSAAETLARIDDLIGADDPVLVLYQPTVGDHLPIDGLRSYARFVTHGSYMIVVGTVFSQPWLGYSTNWTGKAIKLLLEGDSTLAADASLEQHIITACPGGFIQRVQPTRTFSYDAGLDDISSL